MEQKKVSVFKKSIFLLTCVFLVMGSSIAFAEKCQIIRVDDASKVYKGTTTSAGTSIEGIKLEVFPEKITVPVGTCTIWINWMDQGAINVSFTEDVKACVFSASGFIQKEIKAGEVCYLAESVGKGRTVSLTWEKPGVYNYTVEFVGPTIGKKKPMTEGVIEVK